MKISILAAVAVLAVPQVALAQTAPRDLLHATYALWGMMDAAANFCWEVAEFEVSYMEAHQDWLARNVIVRDELDATLAAAGETPELAASGEAAGSSGILDILRQATNPEEACTNWYKETVAGRYDAEAFMAEQLGLLRERDGM